ncbi:DUF1127 domain-containing protein [Aurantimonas endophytica]|uniref:Uncharacterized protein YjiS (DUF1127 family) n=1 Tax=Aurantimonas endophytica TaxID=1522175 RepID=A0A7W6HAM6_9HYPH|nr:DUF1127 domain-containing protein [Aurantimonas endophytica]MBB4001671.1 uncharacterized protein YjiS (DUF1127 family) [Aurantimonas endophytica]
MSGHYSKIAQNADRSPWRKDRPRTSAELLEAVGRKIREARASLAFRLRALSGRARMRRDLLDLDDFQLKDLGLTRDEALRAAERIEWRCDWK